MKILVFSTAYLPLIGGAEIAVKEITDRLGAPDETDRAGNQMIHFDLITARLDKSLPAREDIGRVKVHRLGFGFGLDKFLLPIFGLAKAIGLNRKNNYQIIWSIMASWAGIAALFFKIFKPDKKLILTLQEGDEEEHLKRYVFGSDALFKLFVQPFHRLVIKKADYLTAISNHLKSRAIESGAKAEVGVVPNGVSIGRFTSPGDPGHDSALRAEKNKLGINENEKIILSVSRLVEKNGLEDLIRGMALLNEEFKNWKLLIVGSGKLNERLLSLAKDLGISEKVKFLGAIPNEEIVKFYLLSDIFIRPSLSEGLGNVFLEAMAAGLPVIGTPVGGIPDFLIDGQTGLFCRPADPESVKQKVLKLLDDANLRAILAKNGIKLVKEKYSWDLIANLMKEVFTGLCQKR